MAKPVSQISMDFGFSDDPPEQEGTLAPDQKKADANLIIAPAITGDNETRSATTLNEEPLPIINLHESTPPGSAIEEAAINAVAADDNDYNTEIADAPETFITAVPDADEPSILFIEDPDLDPVLPDPGSVTGDEAFTIAPLNVAGEDGGATDTTGSAAAAPAAVETAVHSGRGRRSLKKSSLPTDQLDIPDDEQLFSKQYYSMGDVSAMFREKQSLIRYWETEFDILRPKKNGKGDRFFRPVDVKNLVLIYDLLRRRKFTIEGAREYLRNNKMAEQKFEMIRSLEKIRSFLLELKASL